MGKINGQNTPTLNSINALANERQMLWSLAGKQRLTSQQRERLQFLHKRIDLLWDLRRREIAAATPVSTEKRVHTDVFADFIERQHQQQPTVNEGDLDGFTVEPLQAARIFEPDDYPVTYVSPQLKSLAVDVLREVLAAIHQEERSRAALRPKQHEMPLRRLQKQQGFLTGAP